WARVNQPSADATNPDGGCEASSEREGTGVRRIIAAWVAAILAALVANSAPARRSFPARTVKFIVPFPGGGINDVLARIIGDKLQAKWGQPVVVENKTGAGGNIGAGDQPVAPSRCNGANIWLLAWLRTARNGPGLHRGYTGAGARPGGGRAGPPCPPRATEARAPYSL